MTKLKYIIRKRLCPISIIFFDASFAICVGLATILTVLVARSFFLFFAPILPFKMVATIENPADGKLRVVIRSVWVKSLKAVEMYRKL